MRLGFPVPERHGQTDRRQMDSQTTYCGITALCVASRGKNDFAIINLSYKIVARITVKYFGNKCNSRWKFNSE